MKWKAISAAGAGLTIVGLMIYTRPESPRTTAVVTETNAPASLQRQAARDRTVTTTAGDSPASHSEARPPTNVMALMLSGKDAPKLNAEQAEAYLEQNHRRVENLLAASDATGDRKYLHEAMEKHPEDPRVAFRAAFFGSDDENESARNQSHRKWLDQFKADAPDNAMADYLSAADHFRSGDKDKAMQEVAAAAGKSLDDYSQDFLLNSEEAYRNAGYSEAEAKLIAGFSLLLPQEAQFRDAGKSLVALASTYRQAGDDASAQAALQMAVSLGQRLNTSDSLTLIQPLVGIAIQRTAYDSLDPNSNWNNSGTVQQRIDNLLQQREDIKGIAKQSENLIRNMSDSDLIAYMNRGRLYGERAALQWAATKTGP